MGIKTFIFKVIDRSSKIVWYIHESASNVNSKGMSRSYPLFDLKRCPFHACFPFKLSWMWLLRVSTFCSITNEITLRRSHPWRKSPKRSHPGGNPRVRLGAFLQGCVQIPVWVMKGYSISISTSHDRQKEGGAKCAFWRFQLFSSLGPTYSFKKVVFPQ